jgi:2-polyprenyl-6-methoxyphenol hydroxylase-like FAD-dependent oxidoreductase
MVFESSKVDVLIVGAWPAGLMAATWMSRCGINARIVDKGGTKIFNGRVPHNAISRASANKCVVRLMAFSAVR